MDKFLLENSEIEYKHQQKKRNRTQTMENIIHGIFLLLGLITVGCVLLITVYLVISGIPAIREIGLVDFLFGKEWASTAAEPKYGILPFILTSVYGTAGAILIGVPIGFFTAVYLSKVANKKVKTITIKPKNRLTNKRRGRVFSLPKTAKPLIFLLTKLQFLYEEVFTHPCELVHYGYAQRDGSSRQSGW